MASPRLLEDPRPFGIDTKASLGDLSTMTNAERQELLMAFSDAHIAPLESDQISERAHWIEWIGGQPWLWVRYRFPNTVRGSYTREVMATVRASHLYAVTGTYPSLASTARSLVRQAMFSTRLLD